MKLLGIIQTKTLAQLSIALNAMHVALTLTLPRLFLPTTSAAFPMSAQILIWIEFFLAFVVFLRPIDALIAARAYPQSDVDNVSITDSITPQAKRSLPTVATWIWSVLTLLAFVTLALVIFHQHPPRVGA